MCVYRNMEGRSDLCALDPCQIVIPFNILWSYFLLLFTIVLILWIIAIIIIIINAWLLYYCAERIVYVSTCHS
jgi:hypothetical protein